MDSLDTILSGREPVTETEKQETTQAAATETTKAAEQTTEQATETTKTEQAGEPGKAPIGVIRQAEREKATKRYTEQVAEFEAKQAERDQTWERRFTQLLETVKPPQQQPQQAPDFFENPNAAVMHTVAPEIQRINGVMMHNSRLIASQLHTEDAVKAADKAFTEAYEGRKLDPADYQRVINSPNIFDAAVKWHQRVLAQAEIGPDPAVYKAKLEAEIRAKIEAEAPGTTETATNGTQQRSQVMPSNLATARNVGARSGPAWAGPTPLGDIFKR